MKPNDEEESLTQARQRLYALVDDSPMAAIASARDLPAAGVDWQNLRGSVLCNAGEVAGDLSAIEEASEIFSQIYESYPDRGDLAYNLANSLSGRARLDKAEGPDWFLRTAKLRYRSRALFGEAARVLRDENPRLASQSMTNLGNSLDSGFRWVEAYECYQAALELFPRNGVASGCAAEVLLRIATGRVPDHGPHLFDLACRLAHHAKVNRDVVAELAGSPAVAAFDRLPSEDGDLATVVLDTSASPYDGFVADNRLLLSPILEGLGHDPKRWDDAHILRVTESINEVGGVPPLFAMFNVMKADYLVARHLLFQGMSEKASDSGLYFDTLDYAVYGVNSARLVLAQRSALDLLDKLAVALNQYLAVGRNPKSVTFHGLWRERPSEPSWRPVLAKAIEADNPGLIALSEISADLADGSQDNSGSGLLSAEKKARRTGTHRFTVLHDIGSAGSRADPAVEHFSDSEFRQTAIRTVRLARAALLHFLEVVSYSEHVDEETRGPVGVLLVQPHHVIRGEP